MTDDRKKKSNREAVARFGVKMRQEKSIRLSGFIRDEQLKKEFARYRKKHGLSVQKTTLKILEEHLIGPDG